MTNQVSREVAVRAIAIARAAYQKSDCYGSSAMVGLHDAVAQYNAGNFTSAQRRAMGSIAYSCGMFSDEYRAAASTEV